MATSFWGQTRPGWGWGLGGIFMIFGSNHITFLIGNLAHGAILGVKGSIALGCTLFSVLHLVDKELAYARSAALIQGVVFQSLAKAHYEGGHFFVWSGQLPLTHFVILLINLPIVNCYIHATFLTSNHALGAMFGVLGNFALGSILFSVQHLVTMASIFGLWPARAPRTRWLTSG